MAEPLAAAGRLPQRLQSLLGVQTGGCCGKNLARLRRLQHPKHILLVVQQQARVVVVAASRGEGGLGSQRRAPLGASRLLLLARLQRRGGLRCSGYCLLLWQGGAQRRLLLRGPAGRKACSNQLLHTLCAAATVQPGRHKVLLGISKH